MANIRVKDLDTKASFASDDEILMDSPSGTGTMLRDAFISAVASQIVAAPSTYKIATLDGANKLTSSQDPSQSVSYLGGHDMVANSPALADGSGTAGDTYYVTNPGTRDYGSGNITAQEGDALVYSGSVWQLVEGIANILDGISTASTARTTLEVNSKDEDAQANALKTTAPALYFNGSSSVVEVADDPKLSFTDVTDDLAFSISSLVEAPDVTSFPVVSKFAGSGGEWYFEIDTSDKLKLFLNTSSGNNFTRVTSTALTSYQDTWVHVAVTYAGAGPNSDNAFSSAGDGITLYVNGQAVSMDAASQTGTYAGMPNTGNAVWIGRRETVYKKSHIREVKIFNRELTASEVAELARGNDLGFAD
ncbi:MAG: LamG domain-containing protein, partial [bacterium]